MITLSFIRISATAILRWSSTTSVSYTHLQAISDHEYEIERLQASLAAPEISSDYQKVSEVCAQLEQTRERLNALIEEWAELAE